MVSSATGIFETFLSGDPSTGNLATAKTLDRPMELMFVDRQSLWYDVIYAILQFVIDCAAIAPSGLVSGTASVNPWGDTVITLDNDTENEDPDKQDKPIRRKIDINFPDILERDVVARVGAVVSAATLNGQQMAGTIPDVKKLSGMLLTALGTDNIDEELAALFPEDGPVPIPPKPVPVPFGQSVAPDNFVKAAAVMESLRVGVEKIIAKYDKTT
jgi:hypothetical protein